MRTLNFLVIGKNKPILDILVKVIHKNSLWSARGFTEEEEAFDFLNKNQVDIVLLSCGLESTLESEIKEFCLHLDTSIKVIEHYGGGSGLLKSEVLIELPGVEC